MVNNRGIVVKGGDNNNAWLLDFYAQRFGTLQRFNTLLANSSTEIPSLLELMRAHENYRSAAASGVPTSSPALSGGEDSHFFDAARESDNDI